VLTILITALVAGTLYYFSRRPARKITLAMAEDEEAVGFTGIDTRSIHLKVFVIGIALAALGGALTPRPPR